MVKNVEFVEEMASKYKDPHYRDIKGLYIVIQGHVDILDHESKKKIFQIDLLECFGQSTFIDTVSYEYLGDIYAGFSHVRTTDKAMKEKMGALLSQMTMKSD